MLNNTLHTWATAAIGHGGRGTMDVTVRPNMPRRQQCDQELGTFAHTDL